MGVDQGSFHHCIALWTMQARHPHCSLGELLRTRLSSPGTG